MKRSFSALIVAWAMLAPVRAHAAPPTKLECAAAHQDAQRLRKEGDLRGAHDKLLLCSRDPCPKVVLDECLPWLAEVERAMPSLVLEARTTDGHDVPDVRVTIDGRAVVERLDGRPVDVNPGEHLLRFVPPRGAAVERRVLVAQGEKGRIVRVEVESATPIAPAPPPGPPPPADAKRSGPPPSALLAGGVGVVALGGFTFFALNGLSAEHGLDDCSPRCSSSRIDSVERRYIAADVFLGAGVAAFAVAAYLWLSAH